MRDSLIKEVRFCGENIWRPPSGSLKQGPTHNHIKSSYQQYEGHEQGSVAPTGGDNVSTQQLLETRRTFQEAVVASRVEIAASRADNEELRRNLQQAGKHVVDERAPPISLRARPMPFSQAIMDTVLPTTSLGRRSPSQV